MANQFEDVRALAFEFEVPFPVMVSGANFPTFDFEGCRIQRLVEHNTELSDIAVTSFADNGKGYIVFSWIGTGDDSVCEKLIHSLINKEESEIPTLLMQYMFSKFENVFVAPEWWDELDDAVRDELSGFIKDSVDFDREMHGDYYSKAMFDIDLPKVSSTTKVGF